MKTWVRNTNKKYLKKVGILLVLLDNSNNIYLAINTATWEEYASFLT